MPNRRPKEAVALVFQNHRKIEQARQYGCCTTAFFLLPSCGRFLIIPKEILLYMVHYLSVLDSVCIRAKKYCGLPVLKNSYQKSSVSD